MAVLAVKLPELEPYPAGDLFYKVLGAVLPIRDLTMKDYKAAISLCALIAVAFVVGLKQDAVRAMWEDLFKAAPVTPETGVTPDVAPVGKDPAPQVASPIAIPKVVTPGGNPTGTRLPFAPTPGNLVSPTQTKSQESLGKTLDSINSGEVKDEQIERRNLYFERLSQQLKELQGQQPQPSDVGAQPGGATEATGATDEVTPENPTEEPLGDYEDPPATVTDVTDPDSEGDSPAESPPLDNIRPEDEQALGSEIDRIIDTGEMKR